MNKQINLISYAKRALEAYKSTTPEGIIEDARKITSKHGDGVADIADVYHNIIVDLHGMGF